MTLAIRDRQENHLTTYRLLMQELAERAIDTALFDAGAEPFASGVRRTTWEEMVRTGHIEDIGPKRYRLTAMGWLVALEVTGLAKSGEYERRLGHLCAAMKRHVKDRGDPAIVELVKLAEEAEESAGWVFNVIDSKGGTTSKRTGAGWYGNERGRLVEIPVSFNMEPVDIAAALTVGHLERIVDLEAEIALARKEMAQYRCPSCDAPVIEIKDHQDPEGNGGVLVQRFACGFTTENDSEESPCPYGPNWPTINEFEFEAKLEGNMWICVATPTTDRARKVHGYLALLRFRGLTKEGVLEEAIHEAVPKLRGYPPSW